MTVIDDATPMGYTINKIICDNGSEFLGNFVSFNHSPYGSI